MRILDIFDASGIVLMVENSKSAAEWWRKINASEHWQDGIFYFLSAAFAVVSAVALVLTLVLLDLPGILFFSTYTLLVLFWAEIYHQARSLPTDKLRILYISTNSAVYLIQVCIWVVIWVKDNAIVDILGNVFMSAVSFLAALGFLLYGGSLFFMLRRFPIESKGRRKKLHEVGSVTGICFTCFLIRCFVVGISAFDANASLDVLYHPILNFFYYTLTEIVPSALVLCILRKLPPKRISAQYHPIR